MQNLGCFPELEQHLHDTVRKFTTACMQVDTLYESYEYPELLEVLPVYPHFCESPTLRPATSA